MTTDESATGPVVLTGEGLTTGSLLGIADGDLGVVVPDMAWNRVTRSHERLQAARAAGEVYGASTGVGANLGVRVEAGSGQRHLLGLLRSHCAGVGPIESASTTRAALAIRLNQILAGGSGVSPTLARTLAAALVEGAVPTVHGTGAIGTADLAQLAETALTLLGERPWRTGSLPPADLADTDALPFMSSSAFTLARAATAAERVGSLLGGAVPVAALSFLALRGAREAWDPVVHARTYPEQAEVAATLTALVTPRKAAPSPAARLQDPFALRTFPQTLAPALHGLTELRYAVEAEMNAAHENPLVTDAGAALHHGQFHLATVAARLDHLRTALVPVLSLVAARVSLLLQPAVTGLPPFLSDGAAGSSGLMIAEYVAQDALASARTLATPTTSGAVSISLGREEHASFATQGSRQLDQMVEPLRILLALEAVAAVRALRLDPSRLPDCPARQSYDTLAARLSPESADHRLGDDLDAAAAALPGLLRD